MAKNLDYDNFTQSIRTVLKLRKGQDDAIVQEVVEAAVRDLTEEFEDGIKCKLDCSLEVVNEETDCGTVSRIYLPDDAMFIKELYIDEILVTPIGAVDEEFWREYQEDYIGGLQAFPYRTIDGCFYVQFAQCFNLDDGYQPCVKMIYKSNSSDISYIPELFKNAILYGCIYHYRNFYTVDDPSAQSKAQQNYNKQLAKLRAGLMNQNKSQKRNYEVEWKKLYRYILNSNQNDFFSIYTGRGSQAS